jgi:hypothetical protein
MSSSSILAIKKSNITLYYTSILLYEIEREITSSIHDDWGNSYFGLMYFEGWCKVLPSALPSNLEK